MIDAHTHLHFEDFDEDLDSVIRRAVSVGVEGVIVADYDAKRRDRMIELAEAYPGVWCCTGVHPWPVIDAEEMDAIDLEIDHVERVLDTGAQTICGVGECGLDGIYRGGANEDAQIYAFRRLLDISRTRDLPVVIHSVRKNEDVLKILSDDGAPSAGGIIHGFQGSVQQAERFVGLGFDISIGLAITGTSHRLERVVSSVDRSHLVVETDCPDNSPRDMPAQRGEPRDIVKVIERVGELWGVPIETVAQMSADNVRRRFSLPDTLLSCLPVQEE